jgi:pimeloyl-ACP methyl ester carboxylesterase
MQVAVNGTRLWFDVEGPALIPHGRSMVERPTLVLVHGGPGSFDHSYFKPWFARLADWMQVVYLDLRGHGRSAWGDAATWTFEACADDVRAFCDALGIEHPVVLGHSMGGFIAILYGSRHPGHASGLILLSTFARFDLDRLVEGFRREAGDEVASLARRDYAGEDITDDEGDRVFAAFGPHVPSEEELARRIKNPNVNRRGGRLLMELDLLAELPKIASPTLVCVGSRDPLMATAADEILDGLRPGLGRLEVIDGAGHFAWLDAPDGVFGAVSGFVEGLSVGGRDARR